MSSFIFVTLIYVSQLQEYNISETPNIISGPSVYILPGNYALLHVTILI
jgi:hypothetical protein